MAVHDSAVGRAEGNLLSAFASMIDGALAASFLRSISERAGTVRQLTASEVLTMTAQPMTVPVVAAVFAAGRGPPAGPRMEL